MNIIILAILALIFPFVTNAQQKLEGVILNENKDPIPYVTIAIGYGNNTLKKVRSSQKGIYEINLTSEQMKQVKWIEARHISYETTKRKYYPGAETINFQLIKKSQRIEEVIVKSKPRAIRHSGDTTRYAVSQFVSTEDRNIGDVLKRMPGVEVDDNGIIKHNGKTVNRMYIDGDQLFQNGYSLGTKTIKPQSVKTVEVIQNHEHKKIKQGVSNSDEVALNLVIEDDAKTNWSGEASLGVGIPMDLFINSNLLSFKKKYKTINALQFNSIGESISQEVQDINSYNLIEPIAATRPEIPKNRYYKNKSLAFNTNHLYKWKENWTVTFNSNIWVDQERSSSIESQTYILPKGNIVYINDYNTTKAPFFGRGVLAIEGNSDQYFFKNSIDYKLQNQTHNSWLTDDDVKYDQVGKDRMQFVSEKFEYIPKLKNKDLLSINGNFKRKWHNDILLVTPGIMDSFLNEGRAYSNIRQRVDLPMTEGNIGFVYTRSASRLKNAFFINALYTKKQLNSELLLNQKNVWHNNSNFPNNNIHWNEKDLSTGLNLDWKNNTFIISTSLPISWSTWNTNSSIASGKEERINKFFFNPSFSVQAYLPNRDYIIFSSKFSQNSSDINQAFRNAILTNFRNLETYNAPINFKNNASYILKYSIERPIELFYAHISAIHMRASNEYLLGQTITQQGILSELLPFHNKEINNTILLGMSKSIIKSGLFIRLNNNMTQRKNIEWLNNTVWNAHTINLNINANIEYKGLPHSTISYHFNFNKSWNTLKNPEKEQVNEYLVKVHKLTALYQLRKAIFIKGSWIYDNNKSSTFSPITNGFLDASIRYKPLKSKHTIEFNMNNILNKRIFHSYMITPYQQNSLTTPLRGIQAVLTYSFLF